MKGRAGGRSVAPVRGRPDEDGAVWAGDPLRCVAGRGDVVAERAVAADDVDDGRAGRTAAATAAAAVAGEEGRRMAKGKPARQAEGGWAGRCGVRDDREEGEQ